MIFGSAQNLLFEFKHQILLHKKEKEKEQNSHAAGPPGLGPRRPERSVRAGGARCPLPPHADTDERAPLVSSVSLVHGGLAALPVAAGEVQAPHQGAHQLRLYLATPEIRPEDALPSSSYLGHAKGGGRPGRPWTGPWGSVEHKPTGPGGSGRSGD